MSQQAKQQPADDLRQTSAGRHLSAQRSLRAARRATMADPLAKLPVETTKPAPRGRRPVFFEEEPLSLDHALPETGARHHAKPPLPAEREVVRVLVIGSRVRLVPSGLFSSLALGAARAELDHKVDARRKAKIYFFDRVLRRGALNWKNLLALLRLKGIAVEIDPSAERLVAAYNRRLARQMTPIERTVWRDEKIDYQQIEDMD